MDKTADCLILVLLVALALLAAACEPTAPHIVTKVATPTPDAVVQKVVTATPRLTETRVGKRMTITPKPEIVTATPSFQAPTLSPAPNDVPVKLPEYRIIDVRDVSIGVIVRLSAIVATEFPISAEQCDAVCDDVIQHLKERRPLNAAVVFLFDSRAALNYGYSLARCFYAPNGEWGDAIYVQAGDYSTHRFVNDYRPNVEDPEAAMAGRPTEQEYEMCVAWDALVWPASENLKTLEEVTELEDTAYKKVAEEQGVSVQRVKDVILKCIIWPSR